MFLTRAALGGLPVVMTASGALMMRAMHMVDVIPPTFSEIIRPFGPRQTPDDTMSCEEWLQRGIEMGVWQSLDGSGRPGAVARFPIFDEHWFIGARTRWGKSTCEWQILDRLSEAIKAGFARFVIFDPKNGMELAAAVHPLNLVAESDFHWGENVGEINPETKRPFLYEETFIKSLEDLVLEMRRRGDHIRFHDVRHHAKPGDPHIFVMIDELSQLVRATTPPEIRNRITNALLTLLNMGAACGITVIGCAQRPTIEQIGPVRNAFTFGFCGLVRSPQAVDMVLDQGARKAGAYADKLDRHTRGVWYASDSGAMVMRTCNAGPRWIDREGEHPDPEEWPVTDEDQEAADNYWEEQKDQHRAFHPYEGDPVEQEQEAA
jgi:hypothetical protein